MAGWVRKLRYNNGDYLISIPRKLVKDRGWGKDTYWFMDGSSANTIVLRRVKSEKSGPLLYQGDRDKFN